MPRRLTPLDFSTSAIDLKVGRWTARWEELMRLLFGDVATVSSLPAVINRGSYTELNALGLVAADAGYLAFETETGHTLRWTGSAWEFAPGDKGNGFREDRAFAPQDSGYWRLCDGGATTYLALGAALSLTAFTTPDLVTDEVFYKSKAAFSGAVEPAGGTSDATAPSLSGSTASDGAHTHSFSDESTTPNGTNHLAASGAAFLAVEADHTHDVSGTTGSDGAHTHGVGTLAVASHTHGPGDLAPTSSGWLPYFRR